jgi:hypothetical protein
MTNKNTTENAGTEDQPAADRTPSAFKTFMKKPVVQYTALVLGVIGAAATGYVGKGVMDKRAHSKAQTSSTTM